jgi:PAS domain S-box-containing protein
MLAPAVDVPRILVVGGDGASRAAAASALSAAGFRRVEKQVTFTPPDGERPDLLVVTGDDVAMLCAAARARPDLADVQILAVVASVPADAAGTALVAGADDTVTAPPLTAVIGNRARRMLRADADRELARESLRCEEVLLQVHDIMAGGGDSPEALREALLVMSRLVGFERASLVAHIEGSDTGYVIAATDDPTLSKFKLQIDVYPEILHALHTRDAYVMEDAQVDDVTRTAWPALKKKGIRASAVFPIIWHRRVLGALLLRREQPGLEHFTRRKVAAARLFAGDVAAQLADGKVMANLREQTHRISRARYETERRLRAIDTVKQYFDAASDGVIVLDNAGSILFVNRSAESITGFARDGLLGTELVYMVPEEQRLHLREAIRSVAAGTNVEPFDMDIATTSGDSVTVSVATSTVLANADAAILLFRDVTAERVLEYELRKTKDFLERLIDSTVDAIVAADTDGNIILFNQGAERIVGYAADEMIGNIPVTRLYPEGIAHQVMRMLRADQYGGIGRLEQTRRELLTKSGELVPVNMTASIVYEDGREVATVGIFSDLRERIKMEKRLMQAQEKLIASEKHGLVAELAGAAAHELNQPLTSILGYLELIMRQLTDDAPHSRHIKTIQQEAARMAEIVKKIGRITRYETKEYVGGANIIDLDASASSSQSFERIKAVKAKDKGST